MQCPSCGALTPPGAGFCSTCGRNLAAMPAPGGFAPAMPYAHVGPPRTSGMAIAGLICSFFFSLLGLIFSIIALNQIKRSLGTLTGRGMAMAGLIISIANMLLGVVMVVWIMTEVQHEMDRAKARVEMQQLMDQQEVEQQVKQAEQEAAQAATEAHDAATAEVDRLQNELTAG